MKTTHFWSMMTQSCQYALSTELYHSWKRNTAFLLYITNSRIVENENGSVKWSILVINSYGAIFSNSLVLFAWQWPFVLPFQLVKTGSRLDQTGFTQYLLFHYSLEEMIFSIYVSIVIQTETNIVLNKCLHYFVRASNDSGLFGIIFLFHEW